MKTNKLYKDLEAIKLALAKATRDIKGEADMMLSDSIGNVIEKTQEIQNNVAEYVENKPFKALGVALVTGAIIGYIMNRQ